MRTTTVAARRFLVTSACLLAALLAPAAALAQASASAFTSAVRYDAMGRAVGTIAPDPDGSGPLHYAATRTTYDAAGRPTSVEKGELASWQSEAVAPASWSGFTVFQTVSTTYDAMDRKLTETLSASGTAYGLTQYSYDSSGRLECTAVRMNPAAYTSLPSSACTLGTAGSHGPDRITRNVYDAAGQVTKVQKAFGTADQQDYASYLYSLNGKQTRLTDANGNPASMTYDGFDREVQWNFPSATTPGTVSTSDYEAYTYDPGGNRLTLRKRDGVTLTYQYDDAGRLALKTVPASASGGAGYSVAYGYDATGAETYARFGSAWGLGITTAYDGFERVASSGTNMDGTARTLTYGYDADGNAISLTSSAGPVVQRQYDGADRIAALRWGAYRIATFAYDAAGRRSSLGLGIDTVTSSASWTYDGAGRLQTLGGDFAGTSADRALTFAYNPASQIVGRTISNEAYVANSAYDVSRTYSVNGLNQYTAAGAATFTYDLNGNLTGDGTNSYVYDAENRLVSAARTVNGVTTTVATLSYDPHGRLWQVTGPAGTRRLVYDGDRLVEEYDPWSLTAVYVHGPDADEPLMSWDAATGWARRYLHTDHQGSIVALADDDGNAASINAYDEWGIPNAGNQGRFGYTGQAWLPELGMWYYKARIYSPTLGRFLQTDPVGYQDQVNLYAYVGNDPMDGRDPTGKSLEASNAADRNKFLGYINSHARDRYQVDRSGQITKAEVRSRGGSDSYTRKLDAIIASRSVTRLTIGTQVRGNNGHMESIDSSKHGGAATEVMSDGSFNVTVSPRAFEGLKDVSGRPLIDTPDLKAMHELVGHVFPRLETTRPTGNAVRDENVVRGELGLPYRADEPTHHE